MQTESIDPVRISHDADGGDHDDIQYEEMADDLVRGRHLDGDHERWPRGDRTLSLSGYGQAARSGRDSTARTVGCSVECAPNDSEAVRGGAGVVTSLPIKISPEAPGYRVAVIDGSDGLIHSNGVYAHDAATALACVADLLGIHHEARVESPVLDAMKERLAS